MEMFGFEPPTVGLCLVMPCWWQAYDDVRVCVCVRGVVKLQVQLHESRGSKRLPTTGSGPLTHSLVQHTHAHTHTHKHTHTHTERLGALQGSRAQNHVSSSVLLGSCRTWCLPDRSRHATYDAFSVKTMGLRVSVTHAGEASRSPPPGLHT